MTSINLTAAEAQARSQMLRVFGYDITVDMTESETDFRSSTTVSFEVTKTGDTFIDLRGATEIEAILIDGTILSTSAYDPTNGIALHNLEEGSHTLTVQAIMPYSHTGEGLHRFVDPVDGNVYCYTQFETSDAKRMFCCFDQPDLKATYNLTFVTPEGWTVISNAPQSVDVEDGVATHTSRVDYPLSTYLIAVCAGPYVGVHDVWRGELTHHPETPVDQPTELEVPLGIYTRASLAEHLDAERLFTETKQGFDYYHRNFGVAYPYGKYDQIFVPEFNAGAMENAGCVTIRDEYVFTSAATHYRYERRCDTVLHELAHMWFGDLVTMKWWDDLWLNESFATWSAAMSQAENTEYDTAWVTFANVEKAWAYAQDQLPTTHPISTDASDIETVDQNFDGITYAKGASVLKQLQAYVGREEFFAGVRKHFARHAFSNATFDDLLSALEETSGRDLSDWSQQWLKSTGVNHVAADFTIAADGTYEAFAITQTGTPARTHRIAVGVYALDDDNSVGRIKRVELDISGERTEVPELVGTRAGQLVLPNDDDLTYALIDLDEASLEFVIAHIDAIADPMARTLCWSAAWEMTRDGKMRARDFVELVSRGASAETELAVLERILSQALTAQQRYADPEWAESSTMLTEALYDGAFNAAPATALVFEQALGNAPLNDAAIGYFTGKLNSEDAEQRWRAVTALVAAGRAGDEEIDAALAADQTASGRLAATRARAAVPTEASKRTVWDEIVRGDASNLQSRHLMMGLTFTNSSASLQQFNEEFFEVAPRIWAEFSPEMALRTLGGIYPSWDITPGGVKRAETFLERTDLSDGLRRVVAEQADSQKRAVRNRGVDAA